MPQTVEIDGQGVAEFPDDMTPDQIKGVIQQKFYSQPTAPVQEQPSGFEKVLTAAQQGLGYAQKGLQFAMNPTAELHKAMFPEEAKLTETPLISAPTLTNIVQGLQTPQRAILKAAFGQTGERLSQASGRFLGEQLSGLTSPESLALLAVAPGIEAAGAPGGLTRIGKVPMRDIVFGKAQPATPAEAAVEPIPQEVPQPPLPSTVSAGEKLGAQFAGLRTQAADLQARIDAQRAAQAPPVQEAPVAPIVEPIQETPQLEIQPTPEEVTPSSSEITSPEGLPSDQVRGGVDEEAPLRQPGETPQTRQGTEAGAQASQTPVGLTEEAQKLVASGGVPGFVSRNLERIATENRVEVGNKTPNQIIDELKAKAAPIAGAEAKTTAAPLPKTPEESGVAPAPQAPVAPGAEPTTTAAEPVAPTEPPKSPPTPTEADAAARGEPQVGIAERYREDQQPDSVIPGVGKTPDQAREFGHDFINKGGDPYSTLKPNTREPWQNVGIVRAEYERLSNIRRAAERELEANPSDQVAQMAFDNADLAQRQWSKDMQPVLTGAGDALRAASRSYPRELNSMSDVMDVINDHYKGEIAPSPEQRAALQKLMGKIKEGNVAATQARAAVADAAVKKAGGRFMTPDVLKADLQKTMAKLLEDCPV